MCPDHPIDRGPDKDAGISFACIDNLYQERQKHINPHVPTEAPQSSGPHMALKGLTENETDC